jgi:hypothetical protein
MRLAYADPPYPPARDGKNRASRWYGDAPLSSTDVPADFHVDAKEWDDPLRHRQLAEALLRDFDGWAIATTPDGIRFYEPLPGPVKVCAWVRPNVLPSPSRIRSMWEAVLVFPPEGRRNSRNGVGTVDNVLTCAAPRIGFAGAKPAEYVEWVLALIGYEPEKDEVVDVFPGSGSVSAVLAQGRLTLAR